MCGRDDPPRTGEPSRAAGILDVEGSGSLLPHRPIAHPATMEQQGGISAMLVLTRKSNQSIMIGDDIEVSVLAIMGEKVRIGIQAPRDVPVFRREVYLEIQQERAGDVGGEDVDAALREIGGES